jgi:hypothetical protein
MFASAAYSLGQFLGLAFLVIIITFAVLDYRRKHRS